MVLLWIKPSGSLVFASTSSSTPSANDRILSFALPRDGSKAEAASKTARKAENIAAAKTAADEGKNRS